VQPQPASAAIRVAGRYALHQPIASGGMATVHLGRLLGQAGFARTVAIKRLHPQFAADPEFVSMFLDEARLAARIRSPHVVPIVDVVADGGELLLVMEYIQGESLHRILREVLHAGQPIPVDVVVAILSGVLHGLHAAHEASDEQGQPLGIVHRDVSPQNILVGSDGLARLVDFGVAKAAGRIQTTREGQLKGKLAYMAPEQLRSEPVTRRTDVYAASVVLWEALTCRRLFRAESEGGVVTNILHAEVLRPSQAIQRETNAEAARVLERLDAVVLRGLARDPAERFETARALALALEATTLPATAVVVGDWVRSVAGSGLADRARQVADIESGVSSIVALEAGALAGSGARSAAPTAERRAEPPGTQASSISVASDAARPRRRAVWPLAAAGGAVLLAGVVATWLAVARREPAPAPGASGSLPGAEPSASLAPPASESAGAGPGEVPAPGAAATASAGEAAPTTSAMQLAASAAGASKPAPARRRDVTPSPAHTSSPARKDCDPPYYWDDKGKKHYKLNCI
jgi:serine/threonine-protein kinase